MTLSTVSKTYDGGGLSGREDTDHALYANRKIFISEYSSGRELDVIINRRELEKRLRIPLVMAELLKRVDIWPVSMIGRLFTKKNGLISQKTYLADGIM